MAARAHRATGLGIDFHLREQAPRLLESTLLRVAVNQPQHGVKAAHLDVELLLGPARVGGFHRAFVNRRGLIPHAQRHIDVRGHVQRVRRGRRNLRIRIGVAQAERGVHWIVVRVDQVVRRAGMLRVLRVDLFHQRGGLHVDGEVPAVVAGAEQRQCIERRDLIVLRKLLVHAAQLLGIGQVAGQLIAGAVQAVERRQPFFFLGGGRLGPTRLGCGRQAGERGVRLLRRRLLPYGVVVGHGLAPIRHRKSRVRLLRLLEGFLRIVVLEAVHQQHAPPERRLGSRRSGGGEVNLAELVLGQKRARRGGTQERGHDEYGKSVHGGNISAFAPANYPELRRDRPVQQKRGRVRRPAPFPHFQAPRPPRPQGLRNQLNEYRKLSMNWNTSPMPLVRS